MASATNRKNTSVTGCSGSQTLGCVNGTQIYLRAQLGTYQHDQRAFQAGSQPVSRVLGAAQCAALCASTGACYLGTPQGCLRPSHSHDFNSSLSGGLRAAAPPHLAPLGSCFSPNPLWPALMSGERIAGGGSRCFWATCYHAALPSSDPLLTVLLSAPLQRKMSPCQKCKSSVKLPAVGQESQRPQQLILEKQNMTVTV